MTETDSDSLSEEETTQLRTQGRKRKMLPRSCRENGQSRLSAVHTSYQKTPTQSPASSFLVDKLLGEEIRNSPQLSVTCGDKKGLLCKEKFRKSEPCILSHNKWLTPTEFEKFGGKASCKKWKSSIFFKKLPLQTLVQENFLPSPSFKRRKIQHEESQQRTELIVTNGSTKHDTNSHIMETSGFLETSSGYMTSDGDNDGDDDHHTDMMQFQGETFPVTCSGGRGFLLKSRFATGRCGKCIRTEDSWLTPQEFLNLNMRDGNWRRHITSHRKPLGTLIMVRVLEPHKVNCKCPSCKEENLLDEKNDDLCFKCNSEDDLVCCDECPRAFHVQCHDPPLEDATLPDPWSCSYCTTARNQLVTSQALLTSSLPRSVSPEF